MKTLVKQRRKSESSIIRCEGDVAYIELTRGKEAIIDASDIQLVQGKNWNFSTSTGYAYCCGLSLHQLLLGKAPDGMKIDHDNRNKLDCRRNNISFVTNSQNAFNSIRAEQAKHISFHKASGKYQAFIQFEREFIYLGLYVTENEAKSAVARAYKLFSETGDIISFRKSWKLMRLHKGEEELKRDE